MSHLSQIDQKKPLNVCVLTVSDTRGINEDKSGRLICHLLEEANHVVVDYQICLDEANEISSNLEKWFGNSAVNVIITTGGTGIGFRDVTVETVTPYVTKPIDGFGELFRFLSYTEDVGSKALLSRATAGAVHEQALFALPGSSKAVKLAMNKLILPEIHHIVHELTKHLEQ